MGDSTSWLAVLSLDGSGSETLKLDLGAFDTCQPLEFQQREVQALLKRCSFGHVPIAVVWSAATNGMLDRNLQIETYEL